MTTPALLRREIRALVFDQYGTGADNRESLRARRSPA